ncbi:MAG: hypothetical protein NTY41_11195 [Proteobacteria bacterium]|nr:hypothetical protein [Pseudomonadota bacterium]
MVEVKFVRKVSAFDDLVEWYEAHGLDATFMEFRCAYEGGGFEYTCDVAREYVMEFRKSFPQ